MDTTHSTPITAITFMLQCRKSTAYLFSFSHTDSSAYSLSFSIIEGVGGWGKRWVQVSQKAFSPCCSLLQLSIFNLGCRLPIGLSTTRRCLIGCSARCATQALFSPLSSDTLLQCREDCSSLLLKNSWKPSASLPSNTKPTYTGHVPTIRHLRCSSTGLTGRGSDSLPRSALSQCICEWHPFWTHSLSLSLSLSLWPLCAPHTARTHGTSQIGCRTTCSLLYAPAWWYAAWALILDTKTGLKMSQASQTAKKA